MEQGKQPIAKEEYLTGHELDLFMAKAADDLKKKTEVRTAKNRPMGEGQRSHLHLHLENILDHQYTSFLSSANARSLVSQMRKYSPHLPVIISAINHVQNEKEGCAVIDLAKRIMQGALGLFDDSQRYHFDKLATADPALFFDFCHKPFLTSETFGDFVSTLKKNLTKRLSNRENLIDWLALNITLRILNADGPLTPLLVGPPGTGKSHISQALASAMTEAGCPTEIIFHSLAQQSGHENSENLMYDLLGTPCQYSNSRPGKIWESIHSSDVRYVILVLDEADKGYHRDALVGLLDPNNLLQDAFISNFDRSMTMRKKIIPILTANETLTLCSGEEDPLWSRLDPFVVEAYPEVAIREILMNKLRQDCPIMASDEEISATVDNVLQRYSVDAGIRKLNWAAQQLLACSKFNLPVRALEKPIVQAEKKKIGFSVQSPGDQSQARHSTLAR